MTMHKRRSLVAGVLLSVLVLFGSTAAQAQTALDPVTSGSVELTVLAYDEILVEWMAPNAHTAANVKQYEIGYIKTKTATVFGAATPTSMKVSQALSQALLDDLDAASEYLIGVRALPVNTTLNDPSPWVYRDTTPRQATSAPPVPEGVLERDIDVAVGDMQLVLEWDEPRPDSTKRSSTLTIDEYEVAFSEEDDGSKAKTWPFELTSAIVNITGLENGTKYYVAVRSMNSAGGWSAYDWTEAAEGTPMAGAGTVTTPTPTPALPLFGMLALGAGLVSAGRRRLRAQRLLKK